jgi:hypothetical protein
VGGSAGEDPLPPLISFRTSTAWRGTVDHSGMFDINMCKVIHTLGYVQNITYFIHINMYKIFSRHK